MGFPASFDESNQVLSAPKGREDEVDALSVFVGEDANGEQICVSCWKLTAAELDEVNRTGRIWLGITGVTMPPAWISGSKPFEG